MASALHDKQVVDAVKGLGFGTDQAVPFSRSDLYLEPKDHSGGESLLPLKCAAGLEIEEVSELHQEGAIEKTTRTGLPTFVVDDEKIT